MTDPLTVSLNSFFDTWKVISAPPPKILVSEYDQVAPSLANQLNGFFLKWHGIGLMPSPVIQRREVDHVQFQHFLADLKPGLAALADYRRTGLRSNVWRAAGLHRDELRNSAVLAWLLDTRGDHGQGADILIELLRKISVKGWGGKCFPLPSQVNQKGYWTQVESCPTGERESRVDIELDGDSFLLFIEVKIDASETNDQLDRYLVVGENKSRGRPWGVIYLTPDARTPSAVQNSERIALSHPNLVLLGWRDVSAVFQEYADGLPQCVARHLISQFSQFILEFSQ